MAILMMHPFILLQRSVKQFRHNENMLHYLAILSGVRMAVLCNSPIAILIHMTAAAWLMRSAATIWIAMLAPALPVLIAVTMSVNFG